MTKEDLENLSALNRELERDMERLRELQAAASGRTSSISGLPHIGVLQDRIGLYLGIIDERKRIIMDRVLESILEYAKLNELVNSIDDPLIRQAVLRHYAEGLTWRQTATRIGGGNTADGIRLKVDRYLQMQNRQRNHEE